MDVSEVQSKLTSQSLKNHLVPRLLCLLLNLCSATRQKEKTETKNTKSLMLQSIFSI